MVVSTPAQRKRTASPAIARRSRTAARRSQMYSRQQMRTALQVSTRIKARTSPAQKSSERLGRHNIQLGAGGGAGQAGHGGQTVERSSCSSRTTSPNDELVAGPDKGAESGTSGCSTNGAVSGQISDRSVPPRDAIPKPVKKTRELGEATVAPANNARGGMRALEQAPAIESCRTFTH